MLIELNISDFAIIDRLNLKFSAGFTVLTGETGAGKSIIIDAVTMLLGGRADINVLRSGSDRARIEGIFKLPSHIRAIIDPILEREGLEGDDPDVLILGREIRSTGRSFCRVNGSTVNLSLLEEVAQPLIDIHGQSEHLSLMRVRQHQSFLDRYGMLDGQRKALTAQVKVLRQVRQELADLRRDEQYLARRQDQLAFQVEEIDAAELRPGEEGELTIERNRLANAEQLSQLTNEAYHLLVEGDEGEQSSVTDMLGQVARVVANLAKLDDTWSHQRQTVDDLTYQIDDLAGSIRDYNENIDFSPARLQEIEERLSLIFSLKRKYGDSIEDIIAFGQKAQAELEAISHSEERIEELLNREEKLRYEIGALALALSQARRQAAQALSQGVISQLADLGMAQANFEVNFSWVEADNGVLVQTDKDVLQSLSCDETGMDQIEFLLASNPGEPPKPLAKVASGGETSRIMLALKTVLASADDTPTLIFDEIDQGIGGRVGGTVGQKLWGLAHQGNHQVLCVTHLPQIAGYAETHYHVAKQVANGRTMAGVNQLIGDGQVDELAQMLGVLSDSTRQSARELLQDAAASKIDNSP